MVVIYRKGGSPWDVSDGLRRKFCMSCCLLKKPRRKQRGGRDCFSETISERQWVLRRLRRALGNPFSKTYENSRKPFLRSNPFSSPLVTPPSLTFCNLRNESSAVSAHSLLQLLQLLLCFCDFPLFLFNELLGGQLAFSGMHMFRQRLDYSSNLCLPKSFCLFCFVLGGFPFLYCLHRNHSSLNSPGGHSCNVLARLVET